MTILLIDPAPPWPSLVTMGIAAVAFVVGVGSAWVMLQSKAREEAQKSDQASVLALTNLLNIKDKLLAEHTKTVDTLKTEYTQIAQVIVKEVIDGWARHTASVYYLENARLRKENDDFRSRLSAYERV